MFKNFQFYGHSTLINSVLYRAPVWTVSLNLSTRCRLQALYNNVLKYRKYPNKRRVDARSRIDAGGLDRLYE